MSWRDHRCPSSALVHPRAAGCPSSYSIDARTHFSRCGRGRTRKISRLCSSSVRIWGHFGSRSCSGRLAEAGALPEDLRLKAVAKISNQAIEDFDSDWLETPTTSLFTQEERDALVERVEAETLAALDDEIYRSTEGYEDEVSFSDRYSRARQTVEAYMNLFAEDGSKYAELKKPRETQSTARLSRAIGHTTTTPIVNRSEAASMTRHLPRAGTRSTT